MIDQERLMDAYEKDGFYSLQLEVGDRCEQGCIYCYMNAVTKEKNSLTDEVIREVLKDSKRLGITAIEWLGGEPLLRKGVFEHMELAKDMGLRNNIWTGGLPLADNEIRRRCRELADPGLISVHVSTLDRDLYEKMHPHRSADDMENILRGVESLIEEGYPPSRMLNSVTYTGLQTPEDMISTIHHFEERYGISTSLNVYHTYLRPGSDPGELARFIPKEEDVAKIYSRLQKQYGSGPLPMNCVDKFYCSATLAVLCDGSVTPCATIREKDAPDVHNGDGLFEIVQKRGDHLNLRYMKDEDHLPRMCRDCSMNRTCFGCRSRSFSEGLSIYGPDPRCFRARNTR
ncbi:MAG: radical SAM protein [Thermoplasmatota archaeon]